MVTAMNTNYQKSVKNMAQVRVTIVGEEEMNIEQLLKMSRRPTSRWFAGLRELKMIYFSAH